MKERLDNLQSELESKELTPEEQEARIKAEKMKIALEKMKAASFQKVSTVFNPITLSQPFNCKLCLLIKLKNRENLGLNNSLS